MILNLADKSRQFLLQSKKPSLDIRWAKVRNKEALLRTLEGHTSSVNSVEITSDSTKIASHHRHYLFFHQKSSVR